MKNYRVYMFLDNEEQPLYIGISTNIRVRIENQHFSCENGNLSNKCLNETHKILFHEALSKDDMKIKERYLINTLKPKYNKLMNNSSKFSFEIDFNWKLYSIDKDNLLNRQKKRKSKKLINYDCKIEKLRDYFWLPYGVVFENKIEYLSIKEVKQSEVNSNFKEYRHSFLVSLNNEIYLSSYWDTSYYTANYKKMCKHHCLRLDRDFIEIIAKPDGKLFPFFEQIDQDDELSVKFTKNDYLPYGLFMRYETIKEFKLLKEDRIAFFDAKLKKIIK